MPHPFKEGEDVIFGKVNFATNGTDLDLDHSSWNKYHDPKKNIPILERTLISGKGVSRETLEKMVSDYEKNLNKKNLNEISKDKFKLYSRLGAGLSASYLLYFCTPDIAINAINEFSEFIGNSFVGNLAQISLCAIPAVFSIVKNVGIPFVGFLNGTDRKRSKIYVLNNKDKTLKGEKKFISLFNSSVKKKLVDDMKIFADNIRKKSNNVKVVKVLNSYIEDIGGENFSQSHYTDFWKQKFDTLIKITEEDTQFPWSQLEQLKEMKTDVLGHMKNNFKFAPLKVTTPNSIMEKEREGQTKQAQNLKACLEDPFSQKLRERVYKTYRNLQDTNSQKELIENLIMLTNDLEKLHGVLARYDFGDSTNQNDRGILREFYYDLYVKFGKTTEKLRMEEYKRK